MNRNCDFNETPAFGGEIIMKQEARFASSETKVIEKLFCYKK